MAITKLLKVLICRVAVERLQHLKLLTDFFYKKTTRLVTFSKPLFVTFASQVRVLDYLSFFVFREFFGNIYLYQALVAIVN